MSERDNLPVPEFDRDVPLAEQLTVMDRQGLSASLGILIGPFRLSDMLGNEVLSQGTLPSETASVEVTFEIEPVGRLEAGCAPAPLQAAARLVETLLTANHRYRMAAELHLAVTQSDYEALRTKHDELAASEQRYRELAASLEQRVQEQVEIIERSQRQIYQSEKLASVGQLAAGVAHEINNPIGFVRGNLGSATGYVERIRDLAQAVKVSGDPVLMQHWKRLDLDFVLEDFGALLSESIGGVDRVARIVSALRDFAQIDQIEVHALDVAASFTTVAEVARSGLPVGAVIDLELDTPLPSPRGEPARFNELLLNLFNNARQAIGPSGRIRAAARLDGDELLITLQDDGCGIPADLLPKVFDPFFTTREVGAGTGLGLTISRDIVHAMGGRIEIASQEGRGTDVVMRFPLAT